MKQCRDCLCSKPQEDFVKNKVFKSGYDTLCLECNRRRIKEWRKANPEKRKIQRQREEKKDYAHNKHLKHAFGITRADWQALFDKQKGCCKICGRHQSDLNKRLFVDHCHTTGCIRGLLCHNCNTLLGHAKDSLEILEKAIKYLQP